MVHQGRNLGIGPEILSLVIGQIYDCVFDPDRWPSVIEALCRMTSASAGGITLLDSTTNEMRFASHWGLEPKQLQQLNETYGALSPIWPHLGSLEVDEPVSTKTLVGADSYTHSRFHQEWAALAGFQDLLGCLVVQSGGSYGTIALAIGVGREPISARDLEVMSYFAPHVRRAILIGDLLDMRSIEADTVKSALDLLGSAVVLTNGDAHIVHANVVATAMLAACDPIYVSYGRLSVRQDQATMALQKAIKRAATEEAAMAGIGIGIPIPFRDGRPAIAHVLPLTATAVRNRMVPSATAAVFISTADVAPPPVEAIAALYELTQAEQKVLGSVLAGRNQAETAKHLDIAESTVKTHLGRIFSKTRADNQSDLAKLAERLAGPGSR